MNSHNGPSSPFTSSSLLSLYIWSCVTSQCTFLQCRQFFKHEACFFFVHTSSESSVFMCCFSIRVSLFQCLNILHRRNVSLVCLIMSVCALVFSFIFPPFSFPSVLIRQSTGVSSGESLRDMVCRKLQLSCWMLSLNALPDGNSYITYL